MTADVANRIAGSMYGLLIGDALGCPVEGMAAAQIARRHGRVENFLEGSGRRRRPPGLHSDDGQQALALTDAVLDDPDHPEHGFAALLVELYRAGDQRTAGTFGLHRGTGANFRRTVVALDAGRGPWGGAQPSAGNGVAMMIAPLGWYFRGDLERLRARVIAVARVKQSDPRGIAAAAAVACTVAHLVAGGDMADLAAQMVTFVEQTEADAAMALGSDAHRGELSGALSVMLAARSRPRAEVLREIARHAARSSERRCHATSGYALASVVTSLYMVLEATSLEDLLVDTVSLGGDADTTGAMVGAMGGARFGLDAIPGRWLSGLRALGAFDDRVEALIQRRSGWRPARSLVECERTWTVIA